MNLAESMVAVILAGILLSVFFAVDSAALTKLQWASARQMALFVAQGTLETDARMLALGVVPPENSETTDNGMVFRTQSSWPMITQGLRDVRVTVTYSLLGKSESLWLHTREITSL